MIDYNAIDIHWIEKVSKANRKADMTLVEKTIRAFVSFSSDSRKFMLKHRLLQVSQESPGLWPPLLKGGRILMEFDGI
jgi:hypothetical protein